MSVLGAGFGGVTLDPGGCFSWIVAGLLAGWLAGLLTRGRGYGCVGDIVLGLIGAFVGLFVLGVIGSVFNVVILAGQVHFIGTIVVAFIGALVLALLGRLIGGSNRARRYYR
jgi:uncharacterized membrane protein YeaQ/YmgE (transglycosylase-associated protein family)